MKKLTYLFLGLLIVACSDDEGNPCLYNPTLTTSAVTNITETSATLNGVISIVSENCDNPTNTEQGFVYATTIQPTIANNKVNVNGTDITTTLENLEPNTTYYARAFLTNVFGEFYGNEVSFMTSEYVAPILKSITVNKYNEIDELYDSRKMIFEDNKLLAIEYSSNGIINSINYYETNDNGLIIRKLLESGYVEAEYFYDENKRIIRIIFYGVDGTFIYEYNYIGNVIEATQTFGTSVYTHNLFLNSNNLIYRDLVFGGNNQTFETIINYQNNNPINVNFPIGYSFDEYQYNSELGSNYYNFYQYIYGEQWKNNLLLVGLNFFGSTNINSDCLNYRNNTINYISDNYVTQYSRQREDGSFYGYNINYEFDDYSTLLKEIRNYFGNSTLSNANKIELVYEYE